MPPHALKCLQPQGMSDISALIARASRAYRFCPACLSLVAIELIARGPSAYRSRTVCLSLAGRLLIARLAWLIKACFCLSQISLMTQIYHTTQEAMHNNLRNLRYLREINTTARNKYHMRDKYCIEIWYDTMTL